MSRAIHYAELMSAFHNRFGIIPDYEHILECTYTRLITPGGTVADIGAHSGRHTAVFANLVGDGGSVHAFEPLPSACLDLLSRKLGHQVKLHQCAISTRRGRETFIHAQGAPEESGFRVKTYNRPELVRPEQIEVSVVPLDDYIGQFEMLQFIKVDAEGAEIDCIESARQTISRFRPFISVEYGQPGYSAYDLHRGDLFNLASSIQYQVGDLFGAICHDLETWERVCDAAHWDWYLVPNERVEEWRARLLQSQAAFIATAEPQAAAIVTADLVIVQQPLPERVSLPRSLLDRLHLR